MISQLQPVLAISKKLGQTPLDVIIELRQKMPEYQDATLTYAGRLDPLAEGVLLIVVNAEIKNKASYLDLPKEYEVEVLLGVETDTYDVLGVVQNVKKNNVSKDEIEKACNSFIGTFMQTYPKYSSKTVNGKPLFMYARNEGIAEKDVPSRKVTITSLEIVSMTDIPAENVLETVVQKINLVAGDFRQAESIESWQTNMLKSIEAEESYQVVKIRVSCTQGTYMRTLAYEIGKKMGTCAIAYSIRRLKVGHFSVNDALHL